MKSKVIKTELGWEPAYWSESFHEWIIEPGFDLPTKAEAEARLKADEQRCREIDYQDRIYLSQMAYACGERE